MTFYQRARFYWRKWFFRRELSVFHQLINQLEERRQTYLQRAQNLNMITIDSRAVASFLFEEIKYLHRVRMLFLHGHAKRVPLWGFVMFPRTDEEVDLFLSDQENGRLTEEEKKMMPSAEELIRRAEGNTH